MGVLVAGVVRQRCSVVDCLVMRCGRVLVCCHEVTKWLPLSSWGGAGSLSWGWLFLSGVCRRPMLSAYRDEDLSRRLWTKPRAAEGAQACPTDLAAHRRRSASRCDVGP